MARVVVVVASSDLPHAALADVVSPYDELHIVVPAVEQSRLQWLTNDDKAARAEASAVGEAIRADAHVDANVEVKPDLPRQLVLDAIAEHDPAKVVVALREGEDATWLEEGELDGLPTEIEGVPVVRISI
jgi:hypothetical protein